MNDELKKIQQRLRETKAPLSVNHEFEHTLRRALLNSGYYSDNTFIRFQKRIGAQVKNLVWPAASLSILAVGMVFLNTQNTSTQNLTPLLETNFSLAAPVANASEYIAPSKVFNNWYASGRIVYTGQKENGARVYKVSLEDGRVIELTDSNPVSISLTTSP